MIPKLHTLIAISVLILAPSAAVMAQDENGESLPPNIVFIFTDDLGYGDVGLFGATDVDTPNIDRIGQEGVQFTNFYSASPVCTPSRAALLTGRYPIRMGIHHVFFPHSYTGMPPEELTVAELLRDAGYKTAIVGKWHLGHHEKYLPLNQGFDEFYGIPYSNDMPPLPLMRGNDYVEAKIDQDSLTQELTDYALNFIDENANRPFFLYLPYPMPHFPLHHSEDFQGVSERGKYGDVIEELDHGVGRIRARLISNKIHDNTLLVFTSDNGPWLLMGDEGGSPGPLRAGKGTTFEGGVRVPTVASFPGNIMAGKKVESPASMLDWFPTIAELSGAQLPPDRQIDGVSLLQIPDGEPSKYAERPLFFYSQGEIEAVRLGKWKYKRSFRHRNNPIPKIIRPILGGEFAIKEHDALLFNLSQDPGEHSNLIEQHPEIAQQLENRIHQFENELGAIPDNITPLSIEANASIVKTLSKVGFVILTFLVVFIILIIFISYRLGWRKR